MTDEFAALDENLFFESDAHTLTGLRLPDVFGGIALDGGERCSLIRWREQQLLPDAHLSAFNAPDEDALCIVSVDILYRQAQWQVDSLASCLEALQSFKDASAFVPGHVGATPDNVVAFDGRNGNYSDGFNIETLEIIANFLHKSVETGVVIANQIHFVNDDAELSHAHEMEKKSVPEGLLLESFLCINDKKRCIGAFGASDHIAHEAFVSGRINEDVFAVMAIESYPCAVDCNALVAFGLERIHEECPLKGDTPALAHFLHCGFFAVGKRVDVMEESPDERRLAVVDMPDEDEVQWRKIL